MKKKGIIIVGISILVVILLIISLYFIGLTSVSKNSEQVSFVINSGTSTRRVIDDLYEAKLIKSKISAMIYIKLNSDIVIKAGTYELDRKYTTQEIFEVIGEGLVVEDTVKVTFIEGKRLLHYVDQISETFGYTKEEILKVINDKEYLNTLIGKYEFLDESILNSDIYYPLEGYLFPATYEFYKTSSIKTIIEKMLDKTKNVLDNYNVSLKESDYSIHEILVMASIIENETMHADQRDEVSQVIYKRLDSNMSLGMDVTSYYGVQKLLSEDLTKSDLADDNAYNTRRKGFIGLPVGPICNPGEASIKAALNPSDTDFVYFYADMKTGKLHFAKTLAEHKANEKKYG